MKTGLVLLLILALLTPAYSAQTMPSTPSSSPAPSPPKDFENGLRVAVETIKEYGIDDDPVKNKRLNEIGYRVAQRAAPDAPDFSFRIVKMEEPNAFALPGGFIFVTSGMLDLDLTDDELAALLGHEITHVRNDHFHRMGKRQTIMNLLYQALVIGIAFGIRDSGSGINPATGYPTRSNKSEILQGSAAFGLVFQEMLLRGFSRELELDADHGGMIAAAGAGFAPDGTVQLFEKMRRSIYEAPGYGYWMTHPYLEDRVSIARTISASLERSKNPSDDQDYRLKTQQTFLQALNKVKEPEGKDELRRMALNAAATGQTAEDLRWWFIHKAESEESRKEPFFRDYGRVLKLYQRNIDEVNQNKNYVQTAARQDKNSVELLIDQKSAGSSQFVRKLQDNMDRIKQDKQKALPLYEEVLGKQMFDTAMLQRYISNYPESPRLAEVQFRLAENYRLVKKEPEAIDLYLTIYKSPHAAEWKQKAKQSLLQIVNGVEDLSSCYKITMQAADPDLKKASTDRMKVIAGSFRSLKNGYEFRRNYPQSSYETPVLQRLTKLATDTFHQAKLDQAIGENQKALDEYNQILRYCSDLPVAEQVKNSIVDFQEVNSNKGVSSL